MSNVTPKRVGLRSKAGLTSCRHQPATLRAIARKVQGMDAYWDEDEVKVNGTVYEILGSGCERTALALCPLHILKVDRYGSTDSQTTDEVRLYVGASKNLRKLLCPIYAYSSDYSWTLNRRAKPVTTDEYYDSGIQDKAGAFGIDDVYTGNVGRIGKRVVVLDYGLSSDPDDRYSSSSPSHRTSQCSVCNERTPTW